LEDSVILLEWREILKINILSKKKAVGRRASAFFAYFRKQVVGVALDEEEVSVL